MTMLPKALLLVALVALAACNNPDRYRDGDPGAGGTGFDDGWGGAGTGGIDTAPLGDVNNPTSPAFFQARVGDRVFFVVDQSSLTAEARDTLVLQARWLNENPAYGIVIEGHADERGTREYNLSLGARRASAVQEFLITEGVAAARLRTISYGKERPVEICSTDPCWSKNRRAVTVLTRPAAS
ncbi:MAG: peptidoglycan-associated lipoprotein Pal [Rhodobacteraceae bacterium]|nr:peptidoglycan-associated lipoprotein Pal [Paracoccaceae bacterium]